MNSDFVTKCAAVAEHPWDSGSYGRNGSPWRSAIMKRSSLPQMNTFAALVLIALLLPVGSLLAQGTLPPPPNLDTRTHKHVTLSRDAREVADEYADVLQELRSTVNDYHEYLQESQSESIKRYLAKLDRFAANLDNAAYVANRDKLASDLDTQIDEVDEVETYVRDSKEVFPGKIYKVIRSLHRDLASVRDLLESDIIDQLDELDVKTADLEAYLEDASKDLDKAGRSLADASAESDATRRQTRDAQKMAEEIQKQVQKQAELAQKLKDQRHGAPTLPVPPKISIKMPRAAYSGDYGAGTSRELSDSITVASPKLPIHVTSRFGTVTVNGSPNKKIVADWSVAFQADSRQHEKEFLSQAQLRVSQGADRYDVVVSLPDLDNNTMRISNSELTVTLPSANPVFIDNSFGEVSAEDLASGLDLTNSYGAIDVQNVKGTLKISSQMGEITVTGANGPMTIHNAYAPISMDNCVGDFELENAYNGVSITGCKGKGTIKNSGSVEVSSHEGDVDIRNSFGSVEVNNLTGNLEIENQFQPVIVRDIKGTVVLANANSEININNITGSLSANNTFGLISAEGAKGPVRLINKNGNIELVVGPALAGNSMIRTSFGTVDLTVPQSANLLVNAKTTFGDINSFVPVKINELGQAKRAALKLGHGADSLSIDAQNSTININGK